MKAYHFTLVGLFASLGLVTAACVSESTEEDILDSEAAEDISEGDELDPGAVAECSGADAADPGGDVDCVATDGSDPGVEPTFWPYGYGHGYYPYTPYYPYYPGYGYGLCKPIGAFCFSPAQCCTGRCWNGICRGFF